MLLLFFFFFCSIALCLSWCIKPFLFFDSWGDYLFLGDEQLDLDALVIPLLFVLVFHRRRCCFVRSSDMTHSSAFTNFVKPRIFVFVFPFKKKFLLPPKREDLSPLFFFFLVFLCFSIFCFVIFYLLYYWLGFNLTPCCCCFCFWYG